MLDDRGAGPALKYDLAGIRFEAKLIENWTPPRVYSYYANYPVPDIWELKGTGAFAVPPKAASTLGLFLEMGCQVLPLPYKGKEFSLCNVMCCIECVDEEHSEWVLHPKTKERARLKKPVFYPDCVDESTLFKIPQLPLEIYCWEKAYDPDCEFRACIIEKKLKGLRFDLAWEG